MRRFADELEKLKAIAGYRSLQVAAGRDFSSNDYLGLSTHPALREAAIRAITDHGMIGAGGSRLLRGHHAAHAALEERAAQFFSSERALYFGSGYLANLALFSTLCQRHDAVIFDARIHASMKEGIHAAPAERYRAEHNDLSSIEDCLKRARGGNIRDVWIAVESVYSMDGDLAPLADLQALADHYEAMLVVDEAHATGVFGEGGRGLCEALPTDRLITVHTCGKALGVAGALVCASRVVIDYLINRARPFIYSTAPPPLLAATLLCALDLVEKEPWRRERLQALTRFAADQLWNQIGEPVRFGGSQIIPILLGEDARALAAARQMQNEGFDVRAIRPPTVPQGSARLRVSLNATHSESDIAAFTDALELALDVTEEPE